MATVFDATLEDASRGGVVRLLVCTFREVLDGVFQGFREQLDELKIQVRTTSMHLPGINEMHNGSEELIMSESHLTADQLIKDRRLSVLAALPPLLFGLGVALDSLIRGGPWNTIPRWQLYLSVGVGLIPMLVIAGVGIYALVKRMPAWGLTWIGAGYMGFVLLVKTASEELAEVGRFIVSPMVDIGMVLVILLAGFLMLVVAAVRGWRQAALFSIGMAAVFCLSLYLSVTSAPFYRHDLALLAAPVGTILSLLTYGYLVGSDRIRVLVLLGVAVINLSPVVVTSQVWSEWLSKDGRPSPSLPLLVLLTAVLVSGPAMGIILNPIRKIIQRPRT